MQRRNPGATSALLQKANSQLKGERVKKPEDELNAYISSLTQKTAQQKKSVNFEDLGDSISISSDIEDAPQPAKVQPIASKFLKKKTSIKHDEDEPTNISKFLKQPQVSSTSPAPAATVQSRYGTGFGAKGSTGVQSSSALSKASALTGKIQQRAATRRPLTLESDSDESFSGLKLARSSGEMVSESLTSESVKIGRDGGKFLKKSTPAPSAAVSQIQESQSKSTAKQKKQESKGEQKFDSPKKVQPFTLKSSLKYSTNVVLTSDEESMAEYLAGLPSSSGDSFEKHRPQLKKSSNRKTPSPPPPQRATSPPLTSGRQTPLGHRPPSPKPPAVRRSPSPTPRTPRGPNSPSMRRRTPSPKYYRSYSDDSNIADSIKSEVVEDLDFGTTGNIIMDLDELGPVEEPEPPQKQDTRPTSESPFRATARKSEKEIKKPRKSALKSTSEVSYSDRSYSREQSPFKATEKKSDSSPFKASKKTKDSSPFRAKDNQESVFKASSDKDRSSPFKAKSASPFKASEKDTGSPFKAKESSPFQASGNDSPFKAKSSSPFKAESKKEKKSKVKKVKKSKKAKDKKSASSDFFSSFGLQSVEDLLGHSVSIKESEYESVMSEVEEVKSEISDDVIHTEKVSLFGSRGTRYDESVTDVVVTELGSSRHSAASYSEDFDSVSERIRTSTPSPKRSSMSEVKTRYSGEETVADYTETFEESDDSVDSVSKTYRTSDNDRSYSDEETYSSYSEDYTKSLVPTSRSDLTPVPRSAMRTTEVQTSMDAGLHYQWNPYSSGMAFPGVPLGMGFVDPTPIAAHVVSADALEAMTAYSPAMLALHDMLKSQLDLTREFLHSQQRMYSNYVDSIENSYHYTTLEDTKRYIKKHRKKKMTFKEALRLVDAEMASR